MGSTCVLSIADYPLGETKASPPADWVSFFACTDFKKRRRRIGKRNPLIWGRPQPNTVNVLESIYEYIAPAWVVRERLDLFGFTLNEFDTKFRAWHRSECKSHRDSALPFELRGLNAVRAREALGALVKRQVLPWSIADSDVTAVEAALLRFIFDNETGINVRLILRAIAEHVDPNAAVVLDVSDQVQAGYYPPSAAAKLATASNAGDSRIVVLTEGVTDTEVLKRSMELLFPHLEPFFVWPNLTVPPMGGTSGIGHTLKALAPLGIRSPLIAVFDNDFEGVSTIKQLSKQLNIPSNFRLIRYPDINSATAWPNGCASINVNGGACSLELYFGIDVLGVGKNRPPIRWANVNSIGACQGSFDKSTKNALKRKFLAKADASTPGNLVGDWEDMRTLLRALISPVELPSVSSDDG